MIFSKRHLLEWTTADSLDKKTKKSVMYYYLSMIINVIVGLFVILYPSPNIYGNIGLVIYKDSIGIFFLLGPLFSYLLGKNYLLKG